MEYGMVGHSIAKQLASQKGLAHKIAFPGPEAVQLHKRHRPLNQNLLFQLEGLQRVQARGLLSMGVICLQ